MVKFIRTKRCLLLLTFSTFIFAILGALLNNIWYLLPSCFLSFATGVSALYDSYKDANNNKEKIEDLESKAITFMD